MAHIFQEEPPFRPVYLVLETKDEVAEVVSALALWKGRAVNKDLAERLERMLRGPCYPLRDERR